MEISLFAEKPKPDPNQETPPAINGADLLNDWASKRLPIAPPQNSTFSQPDSQDPLKSWTPPANHDEWAKKHRVPPVDTTKPEVTWDGTVLTPEVKARREQALRIRVGDTMYYMDQKFPTFAGDAVKASLMCSSFALLSSRSMRLGGAMGGAVGAFQMMQDFDSFRRTETSFDRNRLGGALVADAAIVAGGAAQFIPYLPGRYKAIGYGVLVAGFAGRLAADLIPIDSQKAPPLRPLDQRELYGR